MPIPSFLGTLGAGLGLLGLGMMLRKEARRRGMLLAIGGFLLAGIIPQDDGAPKPAAITAEDRKREEARLAELKLADPVAWLAALKARPDQTAWLAGLAELDPEGYKVELARRQAERERQAAETAEGARRRVAPFMAEIATESAAVAKQTSSDDIFLGQGNGAGLVELMERWDALVTEAATLPLDLDQQKIVAAFAAAAGALQRKVLPAARRDYIETLSLGAIVDCGCELRLLGRRNEVLEFAGGDYAKMHDNADIKEVMAGQLKRLRFQTVRFRVYGINPDRLESLGTPADDTVGLVAPVQPAAR